MATLILNSVKFSFGVRVFCLVGGRWRVGPAAYSSDNGDHGRSNAVSRHQNLRLDCRLGFVESDNTPKIVSTITDKIAGFVYVALAAISLLLTGKAKAEIVFTGVGVTIGAVAVMGDFTLGELLDRIRPLALSEKISPAFPSGHVFATTVFFGS